MRVLANFANPAHATKDSYARQNCSDVYHSRQADCMEQEEATKACSKVASQGDKCCIIDSLLVVIASTQWQATLDPWSLSRAFPHALRWSSCGGSGWHTRRWEARSTRRSSQSWSACRRHRATSRSPPRSSSRPPGTPSSRRALYALNPKPGAMLRPLFLRSPPRLSSWPPRTPS